MISKIVRSSEWAGENFASLPRRPIFPDLGGHEAVNTDPVTVVLLGEPVAWARTRISNKGALFTPTRQRNNAAALQLAAQQAMNGRAPFDCPIRLDLQAEFSIPS